MKINWKLRLKNKATLTALIAITVAFVYQVFGLLGIVAPIAQDQLVTVLGLVINLLAGLGIIVDPTTSGVQDSEQAMEYNQPKA